MMQPFFLLFFRPLFLLDIIENKMNVKPICLVYCPFPGSIEHGRVLLVGHMGMYDYRPYVRRVINNKQIIYECSKGFLVSGPPGATCVDGHWSPSELPKCVKGTYPSIRWDNRRKRWTNGNYVNINI